MKLTLLTTLLSILTLLTIPTLVSAQEQEEEVTEKCAENGNIAPCLGDEGELIFYCDDPRTEQFEATCMPSPQEWQNFLPSCESINYTASCAGPDGVPIWTCDDPEYNTLKYDTICMEPEPSFENDIITNTTDFDFSVPEPLEQEQDPTILGNIS